MNKHEELRKILIDYENEEYGDAIIDEISQLFNYPKTPCEEPEILQISVNDLLKLAYNGCGFYTIDVNLECGQSIQIERGDVDSVLEFEKTESEKRFTTIAYDELDHNKDLTNSLEKGYIECLVDDEKGGIVAYVLPSFDMGLIDNIEINENNKNEKKPDYEKGFNILMDYFDDIPEDEREEVNKQLYEVGL